MIRRDLEVFNIYFSQTYGIYYMHPRLFPLFERMMHAAGMTIYPFGVNDA